MYLGLCSTHAYTVIIIKNGEQVATRCEYQSTVPDVVDPINKYHNVMQYCTWNTLIELMVIAVFKYIQLIYLIKFTHKESSVSIKWLAEMVVDASLH